MAVRLPDEAFLGTSGINSSIQATPGLDGSCSDGRYRALRRRFDLQAESRRLLGDGHAISGCLRMPIPGADFVELWHVPPVDASGEARGALRKLRTCRNLWACPVCSSIITERRRKELQALDTAARSQGLRVVMVTLTFSHRRWDRLNDILGALLRALDRLWSGRAAEAFRRRWAMVGMVRALEVTHSELNGWHPHCHLLVYLPKEMDPQAFGEEMAERWLWALSRVGLSGDEHACRVDDTDAAITAYLAKWGHEPSWDEAAELTKQPVKRGRGTHSTPFDLLAASAAGDMRAGELFVEYVRAFYRRRQLQPTQGLYKLLLGEDEATDEELMDESEARAWLLASIRAEAWRRVPANDAVPELLHAGASGDFDQVAELVGSLGISSRDLLRGVGAGLSGKLAHESLRSAQAKPWDP